LTKNCALPDAGVRHAPDAVLLLQPGAALIDVAEFADVFAVDEDARIAAKSVIEAVVDDLESVECWGVVVELCGDFFDAQRGVVAVAVEVAVVGFVALALLFAEPVARG